MATTPLPGDARLYVLDGVTPSQVTWQVHEETLQRWRRWRMAKEEGSALRARIEALREGVASRSGDLCREWGRALDRVVVKYSRLDRAQTTQLPLTRSLFEAKSGLRCALSDESYRRLLTGANPIGALATACRMEPSAVEALQSEDEPFEYTFLHRVYRELADDSAVGQVQFCLDCISAFVHWTHCPWSKTVVSRHGVSHRVWSPQLDLRHLHGLLRFIDQRTAQSTDGQQSAVTTVLDALECIWGLALPPEADQWLRARYRSLSECLHGTRVAKK